MIMKFSLRVFFFLLFVPGLLTAHYDFNVFPRFEGETTFVESILSMLADYVRKIHDNDHVTENIQPGDIKISLPQDGLSDHKLQDFIQFYLDYCVKTGSKRFCNQAWSGISGSGVLASLLTSITNTSMYTFEVSPLASMIEHALIKKLCAYCGFDEGNGTFVTGGSNGNLLGVLAARHAHDRVIKDDGLVQLRKQLVMFISDQAHYSFEKAAQIIGIGAKNVIKVSSDSDGKMDVFELELEIQRALDEGNIPFFIGATAGTTVLGAFDPLADIARVAQKYGIWVHVDAAYGGCFLFSPSLSYVRGIELVDSVSWDFHKILSLPMVCTAFLTKHKNILYDMNTVEGSDYLFHDTHDKIVDLGHTSLQCARVADCLKLWIDWLYHGDRGYQKKIERLFEIADYAESKIMINPRLRLVAQRQSLNLCFHYIPEHYDRMKDKDNHYLNWFNYTMRQTLIEQGRWMVNYSKINAILMFRVIFVHPALTHDDIDAFFEELCVVGHALAARYPHEKGFSESEMRGDDDNVGRLLLE